MTPNIVFPTGKTFNPTTEESVQSKQSTWKNHSSLSDSTSSFSRCFLRSSFSSRYVLQLKRKNAAMIRMPPPMEVRGRGSPVRNQSMMATRKMVRRAATEDSTGEVREMRTRKEPEKAVAR